MEAALVTAAAGALKPVLGKLAAVLGDEYKRFHGVRDEICSLARELTAMEAFLLQKSMEEDPGVQDKLWMKEVRELSYDIEDSLDDFMVNARHKPDGFIQKIKNLLDKTKNRHKIAKVIEKLKKQVIEVSERQNRYKISEATSMANNITKVNNITVDRRALAIFEDVSKLVGIDGPKEELIRLFAQDTRSKSRQQQNPKMISIVGFGGLGKTTLASQVYKDLKGQFDCHAFVSVSRNPDMIKVLGNIHAQLTGRDHSSTGDIPRLITTIYNFLEDKRYFIVVDDIWNVEIWETIQFAFPLNAYDCRIITTTRGKDVAQSCCSSLCGHVYTMNPLSGDHPRQLFHKRLFNSGECPPHLEKVSSQILKKCAGLPLAIIAISGLLANKEKTNDQWHHVESSMGRGLERNPNIDNMIKIISLSYFDLPHHLKTCLLYLSIFPEDFVVQKDILIRRWIAQGFIQEKYGYTLYEAGEECFNELLNRSLIQPDFEEQIFDEVSGCRVHDTVLDFIVSKSVEENFVTIFGIPGTRPNLQNKVRRLSLQNNGIIPAGLNLSSVRSLDIFGFNIPSLLEFKHLRVLCIEDSSELEHDNLAAIGNLFHLKCLRLNNVCKSKFPDEIAKLRYLETLDIPSQWSVEGSVPPNISVDGRLVHFVPGRFNILNEFEGMDSLEVLGPIVVEHQSSEFFQRLGRLKNLRKLVLDVRSYETQKEMACSIRELAKANLRSLSISFPSGCNKVDCFLEELNFPSQCSLRELDLHNELIEKVPRWMGSLVNLQKLRLALWDSACREDVKILGGLPNLRYIKVIWYCGFISGNPGKAEMERVIEAHPNHPMLVSSDVEDMFEIISVGIDSRVR